MSHNQHPQWEDGGATTLQFLSSPRGPVAKWLASSGWPKAARPSWLAGSGWPGAAGMERLPGSGWPGATGRERLYGGRGTGSGCTGVVGAGRQDRGGRSGTAAPEWQYRVGKAGSAERARQGRVGAAGAAGRGRQGGDGRAGTAGRGRRSGGGRAWAPCWYGRGRGMTPSCHSLRRRLFRWSLGAQQSSSIDRISALSIGCRHGRQCGEVNCQTRRAQASPIVCYMSERCLWVVWGLHMSGRTFDSTG